MCYVALHIARVHRNLIRATSLTWDNQINKARDGKKSCLSSSAEHVRIVSNVHCRARAFFVYAHETFLRHMLTTNSLDDERCTSRRTHHIQTMTAIQGGRQDRHETPHSDERLTAFSVAEEFK